MAELARLGHRLGHATILAAVVTEHAEALARAGRPKRRLGDLAPRLATLASAEAHGRADATSSEPVRIDVARDVLCRWDEELSSASPGEVREALLAKADRRRGAHYTPPDAVRAVVDLVLGAAALDRASLPRLRICEPSCGGGAFLLGMADALAATGVPIATVVSRCLFGGDLDPLSVAVSEASLALWALEHGVVADVGAHLLSGDTLLLAAADWPDGPDAGFDLVIGNPPFQAQLASATARTRQDPPLPEHLEALRSAYTDVAVLFLAHAVTLTRPSGCFSLIQPLSMAAARDAEKARAWVAAEAELLSLWVPEERTFAADVRVIAPVFRRRRRRHELTPELDAHRSARPDATGGRSLDEVLSGRLAELLGVPAVALTGTGTVGDLATATAGFRQQFYGLAPHVVDAPFGASDGGRWLPLITTKLIDPVRNRWGASAARFAKHRFARPALPVEAVEALPPALAGWVTARLAPKLLVATQTRVVEVVVDETGVLLPSVPVIAVHAARQDLWRVAAAISSPPVTAWAAARTVGTALSAGAVKLTARQVRDLPLPVDADAWAEAARLLRAAARAADRGQGEAWTAQLVEYGAVATAAYGLAPDHPVVAWWQARLPPWR